MVFWFFFFFSSRRRHTRCYRDWSSDVCSSDLPREGAREAGRDGRAEPDDVRRDEPRPGEGGGGAAREGVGRAPAAARAALGGERREDPGRDGPVRAVEARVTVHAPRARVAGEGR